MANQTPDIHILVGNKGGASASGESAVLIRSNLEKALSAGIKIKVDVDKSQLGQLKKQLERIPSDIKISIGASSGGGTGKLPTDKDAEALVKLNKAFADADLRLSQFNKYLQTVNPKGLKEYAVQIAAIRDGFSSRDPLKIKAAAAGMNELKAAMKNAGYEGGNVFTYLESKVKTFATYLASSAITMGAVTGVRNIISTVKELDGSLTDLRIVTGGTREETQRLLSTYNQMAQELGTTTKAVATSAVEWQRQGYSLADTNTLIKDSMVLSIVGFIDEAEAATALTAAMKGYQLSVDEAMSVVDKFTATDMVAASSAGTLAEALAKTAANAKLAGLSLDDVIAQLAVVNETMQESGEQTGTFYNTMLSRMGALKAGRLSDPETSEDLSDVEATLGGLGIKLRDSESEFRNFGDVLDEVGGKWESFSSVQQRAIATAFSGTRQQTRFLSLMNGWNKAQEYAEVAAGSAGTALEKFGVYEESVEAKANKMTAAFENMATSILDSGLIGSVLDLGAGIFNFAAEIPDDVKNVVALTASVIAFSTAIKTLGASSLGSSFKETIFAVPKLIKSFESLGNISETLSSQGKITANVLNGLKSSLSNLSTSQATYVALTNEMKKSDFFATLQKAGFTREQRKSIAAQLEAAGATGTATTAIHAESVATGTATTLTKRFKDALIGLKVTLGSLSTVSSVLLVFTAIAAVFAVIYKVSDELNTSLKEQKEITADLRQEYSDITSELDSVNSELETTVARIDELNQKQSLSFVEKEELERLKIQNGYLEQQKKLLEDEARLKGKAVNNSVRTEYEMEFQRVNGDAPYQSLYNTHTSRVDYGGGIVYEGTAGEAISKEQYYDELIRKSKELRDAGLFGDELDDVNEKIRSIALDYSELASKIEIVDDVSQQQWETFMADMSRGQRAIGGDYWASALTDKLDSVLDSSAFSNVKKSLDDLAKQGDITSGSLCAPEYADFIRQLIDIGILGGESGVTLKDLAAHLNAVAEASTTAADSAHDFTGSIKTFQEAQDRVSKLQSLLEDLKKNTSGKLKADFLSELYNLLPKVAGQVTDISSAQKVLQNEIADTKDKANAAYTSMITADSNWLTTMFNSNASWVDNVINNSASLQSALIAYYDGDITNWKQTADAKWKVDSLLVGDLSSLWAKYMGMSKEQIEATVALLEDLSISYGLSDADDSALRGMKTYLALLDSVNTEFNDMDWISTNSGSGTGKTTEPYIADIDRLYESTKKLEGIRDRMNTLEALDGAVDISDYEEINRLLSERIKLRDQENEALHEQNEVRREIIGEGVDKLRSWGFDIDYDPGTNNLIINNLEHINKLTTGDVETTNAWRKEAESLCDSIEEYNEAAIDASLSYSENIAKNIDETKELAAKIKAASDAWTNDREHEISLMENQGGQEEDIVSVYETLMDYVHTRAEEIRATMRGLDKSEAEIESSDEIQALQNQWWEYYNAIHKIRDEQLDDLNSLLDMVKAMIKQEKEDLIDALEAQKDKYSELIALKKESLKLTERDRSYQENVSDKNQEISKLQSRIDALGLDESRSAQAERGALLEQLAEKQRELADLQRDHSIEAQEEALDQEQEDFEKTKDAEIKKIREFLKDNEALTKAAMARIESSGASLFDELLKYALKYTDTTRKELEEMWAAAQRAAQKYGSVVSALNAQNGSDAGSEPASKPHNTVGLSSAEEKRIVAEMQANGKKWNTSSDWERIELQNDNIRLAAALGLSKSDFDPNDGHWYWKDGTPVYHNGGVVGGPAIATPKQTELLALLQKKEMVLTEAHQDNLFSLLKGMLPSSNLRSRLSQISGLDKPVKMVPKIDASINISGCLPTDAVMDAIQKQRRAVAEIVYAASGI